MSGNNTQGTGGAGTGSGNGSSSGAGTGTGNGGAGTGSGRKWAAPWRRIHLRLALQPTPLTPGATA